MNRKSAFLCACVLVCCLLMAAVDGIWKPPYAVKSAIKILLFLLIPLLYGRLSGTSALCVLRPDHKAVLLGLGLGSATFAVILTGYALLGRYIDFSAIPASLMENGGIRADNFLFVAVYIALCNSLLEEFFFRGFAFLTLRTMANAPVAWCFSAGCFALYHAGMLDGWFSPLLFFVTLAALFACGLFLNFLNVRRQRIWASWLIHMCANLAINTVGMILLGIV